MTSLIRTLKASQALFRTNPVLYAAVRNHWNKDYKPGPYPMTEKEKVAAAQKYGVPRAEYKAYPDDGTGRGDYPDLPAISDDSKDPYYPYDYPELKRNYCETLHVDHDLMREDRVDVTTRLYKSKLQMVLEFLGLMTACFTVYLLCEKVKIYPAVLPKQYPTPGKVHYTFEKESK